VEVKFHKHYDKAWDRLNARDKVKALDTIELFMDNPNDPELRLHQLKGRYYPQYSISVSGDLRIHLEYLSENMVMFIMIGTHLQLYR
jgi:mRNA-degrading endonuclease YafQ of YafQ-DinJ toxin-antitoxin module